MAPILVAPFPWLEWAGRALALFNTVALVWLGLTILLNAERRHVGTLLTAGGLLLGGLAAAAHAGRLGAEGPLPVAVAVDWWRLTWLPFAGSPFLWCLVLAWYTARLRTPSEWAVLIVLTIAGQGVFALLLARVPLVVFGTRPEYASRAATAPADGRLASADAGDYAAGLAQADPTLVLVALLLYAGLCVGLGLLALRYPRTPDRFMGDLAFRRARPWLVATSAVVLALSVVVAVVLAGPADVSPPLLDLVGLGLLGLQVTLMGRAVVSYEVFTGKALPRGGLARHWKNSLILAAGFGVSVALSLELPIGGIYRLLVATVLVAAFYALVSWRSFVERERSLDRLRPFVTGEYAYDRLLGPAIARTGAPPGDTIADADRRLAEPFRALCADLLGARAGYLYPLGWLAPLVGPPVAYPAPADGSVPPAEDVARLARDGVALGRLCFPIEASHHGGASWCIPLWGERGLIGLLLLGDKRDGGLYTQEEVELARATCERLIDARATAELARRLLLLQRRRLAEDQILDGRTRRALHDDVLPLLHAAILTLSRRPASRPADLTARAVDPLATTAVLTGPDGTALAAPDERAFGGLRTATTDPDGSGPNGARLADPNDEHAAGPDRGHAEAVALLTDAHRTIGGLLRELPSTLGPELARQGLVGALRRAVDDLSDQFDGVEWRIDPAAERAAAALSPLTAEVLFGAAREAIRNAARHARDGDPSRPLHLTVAAVSGDGLELRIEDDGVGLRPRPGVRRSDSIGPSGPNGAPGLNGSAPGGQGLLLHGTLLATLGGALLTESAPNAYTRVILRVPSDS